MGQDEKALIRLKRGEAGPAPARGAAGMASGRRRAGPYLLPGFFGTRSRSLTPGPSPSSRLDAPTLPAVGRTGDSPQNSSMSAGISDAFFAIIFFITSTS